MSEKWKPEKGETYWFFGFEGDVHPRTYYGDSFDSQLMVFGNMFKIAKEAQSAVEKIKDLLLSLQEPVTDCNQLPKLTAEVFDRFYCPAWVKYAAVDKSGEVWVFEKKPIINVSGELWALNCICNCRTLMFKADNSDWQNSLIERPEKKQDCSDFVDKYKVGEWVTYYEDNRYKYFKIAKIELNRLYSEDGKFSLMCDVGKARLRPYNSEEMKALVGKILECPKGNYLVTFFALGQVKVAESLITADVLKNNWTHLDGKPCGVLEHLNENLEWVE